MVHWPHLNPPKADWVLHACGSTCVLLSDSFYPGTNKFDQLIFLTSTEMMTEGLEVGKDLSRNKSRLALKIRSTIISYPSFLYLTLKPHPYITTLLKATIFCLTASAHPALACRLCLHHHPKCALLMHSYSIHCHSFHNQRRPPIPHRPLLPPPREGLRKSAPQFPSHSASKPSDLHNNSVLCGFPPLRSQGFLHFTWKDNINYEKKRQRAERMER